MQNTDDSGKLVLRVALAILMLFHGVSKLMTGLDPIMGMLAKAGVPPTLAYLVLIGEIVAPVLILIGIWSRLAACTIAISMTIAVLLAHTGQFFTVSKTGGWALELQAFYFMTAIAVALLGAGRYSIAGSAGKWN
jgi:putative oxidoreductase